MSDEHQGVRVEVVLLMSLGFADTKRFYERDRKVE